MKIDVTQEDLKNGTVSSVYDCPVSRAISRALGKPAAVAVYYVYEPFYSRLPDFVAANIIEMLAGEHVEPFFFDLGIPCKSV